MKVECAHKSQIGHLKNGLGCKQLILLQLFLYRRSVGLCERCQVEVAVKAEPGFYVKYICFSGINQMWRCTKGHYTPTSHRLRNVLGFVFTVPFYSAYLTTSKITD